MGKPVILVIDDEKEFLDLMKKGLEPAGYEVITADNGSEGLTKARDYKPDLVICDIKMPKKDGLQVLKELRQDEGLRYTSFIMLTVIDDFKKVREVYDEEANYYITKPVELDKLLKNIPTLLRLRESIRTDEKNK